MLAIKRGRLGLIVLAIVIGIVLLITQRVTAADELVREDTVVRNESGTPYICGGQSVANQYTVSGRYVTWSDDSPAHSVRHTVTDAGVEGGIPAESCANDEAVRLSLSPSAPASIGDIFRLYAPDTTPPTISSLTASSITQTGATITWTTNESATHTIKYGTSSGSYDSYPNSKSAGSGTSASGAL